MSALDKIRKLNQLDVKLRNTLNKYRVNIIQPVIFMLFIASNAIAAPTISGVAQNTGVLTIKGSGFGASGPTVGLFDKFDNGINGSAIPLSSPTVGVWSAYNDSVKPYYNTSLAHNGSSAMQYNGSSGLRYTIPSLTTEVFVSYWLRLDSSQIFPATSVKNTIPTASAWKVTWLLHGTASGFDDVCIPTLFSPPAWGLGGNANNTLPLITAWNYRVGDLSTSSGWFKYDQWVRVSTWLKAGADPIVDNGVIWFSAENGTTREVYTKSSLPMFAGAGTHGWDHWFVGPWSNGPNIANPLFDDVYLSYGPNAAARVEMCDANTFSNSKHCEIQPQTTWADGQITFNLNQGSFTAGQKVYVYVSDSNGAVNSNGYQFTIGAPPPPAPKNVTVTPVK